MIVETVLDLVGRTPTLHLSRFSAAIGCRVLAKLEQFNPGGSHKVRIALGMIHDAERRGILRRGSGQTILEPSGGNTGIGLAIAGALYGYRVLLVIPDNYSKEKQAILRLYGAEIVLSDSRNGNNSHGERALEILLEHPEFVMLNQQRNPANPRTHRETTVKEVLQDLGGQPLHCFVGGIGTGGHVTGLGQELRKAYPQVRVFGVEPEGCDLLNNRSVRHDIQGLSVGIIPDVLDLTVLDGMVQVRREDCVAMVRRVMRSEGLSLGISSAANLVAIEQLAAMNRVPAGATFLTLVYDGVEQYLGYFGAPAAA